MGVDLWWTNKLEKHSRGLACRQRLLFHSLWYVRHFINLTFPVAGQQSTDDFGPETDRAVNGATICIHF